MMIYVNGSDIACLELGGLHGKDWVHRPERLEVRPEQYLSGLEAWLDKHDLSRDDIEGFTLVSGPGSATSLRTSHAMVNTLAFALNVKVTSINASSELPPHAFALPNYSRDPNITATKRDALKRKVT